MSKVKPKVMRLLHAAAVALVLVSLVNGGNEAHNAGACRELQIDATHWTGMSISGSWFLTVEVGGRASVRTEDGEHRFQVSEQVCADLVRVVKEQRFFAFADEYGNGVIDGPMRQLDISLRGKRHSVVLYDDALTGADRNALKRVLRVWVAVRGLFDVPHAVDSRKADQAFLER